MNFKLFALLFVFGVVACVRSPNISSKGFREILKNDGYTYVIKSKSREPIDVNFPNLPSYHKDDFEGRRDNLPDSDVVLFEYKGSSYKLLRNMGNADTNDGNFGAIFDANNDKVLDLFSSGDMETTFESLKADETKVSADLQAKLPEYLAFFEVVLHGYTEFEYVAFKLFVENGFFFDINDIDGPY